MPPWKGAKCTGCKEPYLNLPEHLESCDTETVKVWIFGPEYECPNHYNWSAGPLGEGQADSLPRGYDKWRYLIPREQYLRWQGIQDSWEQINEEMHQITGVI